MGDAATTRARSIAKGFGAVIAIAGLGTFLLAGTPTPQPEPEVEIGPEPVPEVASTWGDPYLLENPLSDPNAMSRIEHTNSIFLVSDLRDDRSVVIHWSQDGLTWHALDPFDASGPPEDVFQFTTEQSTIVVVDPIHDTVAIGNLDPESPSLPAEWESYGLPDPQLLENEAVVSSARHSVKVAKGGQSVAVDREVLVQLDTLAILTAHGLEDGTPSAPDGKPELRVTLDGVETVVDLSDWDLPTELFAEPGVERPYPWSVVLTDQFRIEQGDLFHEAPTTVESDFDLDVWYGLRFGGSARQPTDEVPPAEWPRLGAHAIASTAVLDNVWAVVALPDDVREPALTLSRDGYTVTAQSASDPILRVREWESGNVFGIDLSQPSDGVLFDRDAIKVLDPTVFEPTADDDVFTFSMDELTPVNVLGSQSATEGMTLPNETLVGVSDDEGDTWVWNTTLELVQTSRPPSSPGRYELAVVDGKIVLLDITFSRTAAAVYTGS